MLHWLVTLASLSVVAGILGLSTYMGADTNAGTVLGNLGTELVCIVITVAVVEWFFERRRHQTRGHQLAWDALHEIEHAVWAWQGGPREMDTDEVLGILNAVGPDDPLPDFTEGLFLNIGTRSRRLLNNDPDAVVAVRGLMDGLEHLASLIRYRDPSVENQERRHFGGSGSLTWPVSQQAGSLE